MFLLLCTCYSRETITFSVHTVLSSDLKKSNFEPLNAVTAPFQERMIRSWTLSSLMESNSSPYFFSGRTATALDSEEGDTESSSDEEFIDPLQAEVVDKNTESYESICDKMRAQETEEKQMPHQQAIRRGYPYQATNATGHSDEGTSYPPQENNRLKRRPRYSYQQERISGYSDKKGPQQRRWNSQFRRPENFYQHQGNGRVSRPRFSDHLARTPGYSENEASAGPQQCQWNSAFRRPVYSYQQANRCCSGCPDHEADARANQLPGNGQVRRPQHSHRLASSLAYSYNQITENRV